MVVLLQDGLSASMPDSRVCFLERALMRKQLDTPLHRRDLFRAALAAAATTATGAMISESAAAAPTGSPDKRKARYQAHSAEVENFYRVNSYPAR
jgi:hypothetical protein